MIFSKQYETRWHDTDACRTLRPGAMLTYFEETADLHVRSMGKSLDDMRDENCLGFILARMSMVFYASVTADTKLTIQTWTSEGRGFSTERNFRAMVNDIPVAEATSMWALVDVNSRKPVKIANAPFAFEHEPTLVLDAPSRVSIPKDMPLDVVGTRRIAYSDIDYNLHMNNTRYPDMLCDFMPDMNGKRMSRVTMSFVGEASLGHTLTILRGERDGVYYFRTLDGDKTCLEAQAEFVDIQQ